MRISSLSKANIVSIVAAVVALITLALVLGGSATPTQATAPLGSAILPITNVEDTVQATAAIPTVTATFVDISPDNEGPSSGFFDCPDPCVSGRNGGRVNGLSAVPGDPSTYFAASELGGLFKIHLLLDGSERWQHLDGHLPTLTWDVAAAPGGQRVFATSFYEGRVDLTAALQVSTDGGNTWKGSLPPAPPTCPPPRANQPSGFGIAIRPGSNEVLAGTNCGLARTTDSGNHWTRFDPTPGNPAGSVWDVVALLGGRTYACGDDGLLVSPSGAEGTWTALARPASTGSFCSLAVSPEESYVVFAMFGNPYLFGDLFTAGYGKLFQGVVAFDPLTGSATGVTWLELPNPDGSGDPKSRLPFVATNDRSTGYDVWAGIGNLVRGTCSTPVTPPAPTTARCTAWSDTFTDAQNDQQKIVHNAHGDSGTIVFDPSASVDACPTLYSSDGGVYRNTLITSPECHAPIFAAENAGLHAFMLWGMAEVHRPGVESEDLYIALQDNGLYSTADAGTNAPTWTHGLGADVGDVVADTTTVVAWTGDLLVGDPGFTNVEKVLPKFPGGSLAQVIVEASPGHYMMVIIRPFDLDPPQGTQIPIGVRETTDIKADPVGTLLGNWPPAAKVPCHIQVGLGATGPQPYVLAGTCALGRTDKGADELWTYRDGLWTQIAPPPLKHGGTVSAEAGFGLIAVDPAHANRLYASVLYDGPPRMMRSNDGGKYWTYDRELSDLMSGHGTFVSYPAVTEDRIVPYLQPMMVAFDPEDPNLIVAGGYNSGVFLSADGGATWSLLTDPFTHGMSGIPYLPRPMFASFDHNKPGFVRIYLGTGRGIWRVEVALADLQITKTDLPDPAIAGESLTYTITVANNGPSNASDVTVHDILPADVDYAGSSGSCSESSPRMLSCTIGILAVGAQTSFTVTVNVPPNLVYLNGGPKTITNSATVSSGDIDPNLSNNTASEDTLVKAEADAAIVSFAAVAPPLEVLIGQPVDLTLRKVITNHGPSSPVDVNISRTATAPPGSTVTPAAFSETAPAVAKDELRTIDETFAITCGVPGAQTFSFANAIQLANSTDLDPDLTNNTAAAAVTVECIVPVRIDIEPAVINLKSDGVVPVVVFANKAGEFGLPLAFDPATINVASVHFGPREIVWLDKGGSDETHDKDHGNSSRQRLFHFRVDESSLTSGLLEVCLKGLWLDPNGVSHTFFGCDTVLVK